MKYSGLDHISSQTAPLEAMFNALDTVATNTPQVESESEA